MVLVGEEDRRANSRLDRCLFGSDIPADLLRVGPPTVVGAENEERVVVEILFLKIAHQLAAGLVEPGNVRPIARGRLIRGQVLVFLIELIRCVVRSVRQEDGIPDKERLFVLLCFFHEVVDGLHGFATDPMPKPLVKTVVARISLPPLSGLKRGIPVILQLFYHGRGMLQCGGHGFRLLLGQGPQFFVGPQS